MSKVMSMASSTAFLASVDDGGVSGVGLLSIGLGVGGGTLTGLGCWVVGWPGSMRSGMTIICFALVWNLSGCIGSTRLIMFIP